MCAFIAPIETIDEETITPRETGEFLLIAYPTAFVNSGKTPRQLGETIDEETITPPDTREVLLSVYPTAFVDSGMSPEQLGVEFFLEYEFLQKFQRRTTGSRMSPELMEVEPSVEDEFKP
ncbi:hypothetical protein TNIN_142941 [Trichonephila inaurata madagascariensis]|uniref:Uncharacterized protein n=1 Tax=Trichonephila inaurata madagascariensis TaxID=2747483 RepID=A0A8X6YS54_9ARAC|nr:hypothetical protein TNIN_142941 [Trichonephila inaurata madagascariensis]